MCNTPSRSSIVCGWIPPRGVRRTVILGIRDALARVECVATALPATRASVRLMAIPLRFILTGKSRFLLSADVPLCAGQVARFWNSFRTFRDLAMAALMLLDGLRSSEVLQLRLEDLSLSEAHLGVLGKGH